MGIIAEVGKKYIIKIDKNSIWSAIIAERDKDNYFEYLINGLWLGKSGIKYNFACEIINEIIE